jgi:riboflavin synthase
MFTGLVEAMGAVEQLTPRGEAVRLAINAGPLAQGVAIGDSVAINGCCLTVVRVAGDVLEFDAGSETLRRTNLGRLTTGSQVNLERSLRVGDRLGGHYVTGHIDDTGKVDQRIEEGEWATFWFRVPPRLTRQMAGKGSIAVDGISLTLVDVEADRFSVALIPHTLEVTTLGQRKVGDVVNLETDLLAKYVEQQLASPPPQ